MSKEKTTEGKTTEAYETLSEVSSDDGSDFGNLDDFNETDVAQHSPLVEGADEKKDAKDANEEKGAEGAEVSNKKTDNKKTTNIKTTNIKTTKNQTIEEKNKSPKTITTVTVSNQKLKEKIKNIEEGYDDSKNKASIVAFLLAASLLVTGLVLTFALDIIPTPAGVGMAIGGIVLGSAIKYGHFKWTENKIEEEKKTLIEESKVSNQKNNISSKNMIKENLLNLDDNDKEILMPKNQNNNELLKMNDLTIRNSNQI